jgi:hypothetical protein
MLTIRRKRSKNGVSKVGASRFGFFAMWLFHLRRGYDSKRIASEAEKLERAVTDFQSDQLRLGTEMGIPMDSQPRISSK